MLQVKAANCQTALHSQAAVFCQTASTPECASPNYADFLTVFSCILQHIARNMYIISNPNHVLLMSNLKHAWV